ncbi:MAG: HEAT repeat domain-containing protein [candidate division Zixibacteria bacterium]|nr:HEAT repeat domain-containing protein [candidate division Zixibacteria bacterium]
MSVSSSAIKNISKKKHVKLSEQVLKLKDPDRMEREDAAYELAANPAPQMAEELCSLLYDPDISIRNLVAEVLVKMGTVASEALIKECSSSDHDVRKFAVDIMALIGDSQYVPVLIKLLKDSNENVIGSAAEALGKVTSAEAIEPLIECLNSHPDAGPQVIESLGNIGSDKAIPILYEKSESDNIVLAYAAIEAIGKIDSPDSLKNLLRLMNVENPELRNFVLTAILKKAGSGSRDELFNASGGKFVDYLIEASASDDLEVKKAVIGEMAFWSGDKVVEALIKTCEFPNQEVVEMAQGALRIAGSTGLNAIIDGVKNGTDLIKTYLIEISSFLKSPELLEVILSQAKSDNPDVRVAVAKTLAKFYNQETIDVLLSLTNDDVGHVKAEALKTLGYIGDESIVENIAKHLDDEYSDVSEACFGALVLIGGEKTINLFKRDIESSNIQRKILAVRGLGWIGEQQAVEILLNSLGNEEAEVRRHAVIGLSKMHYPGLDDKLTYLLIDENPEVRKAVVDAYLNILGENAGEKIRVLLDDDDMWVRFYAINALASINDASCLDKLLEIMPAQPPFVQIPIINLISIADDSKVVSELEKISKSENEDIRNAAMEAIESRNAS